MNEIKDTILAIQDAALNSEGESCVSKVITYQQAWSTVLRSRQLKWEAKKYFLDYIKIKKEQIETCWKKHIRG